MMPSIFGENMFDDWFDFPFERSLLNGPQRPVWQAREKPDENRYSGYRIQL